MIARHVACAFCLPEVGSSSRRYPPITAGVHVPKAAMNKDDLTQARKYKVGMAGKLADVKPVAVPEPMRDAADSHFGPRILAADRGHVSASLRSRVYVWHDSTRQTAAHNFNETV